MKIFRKTITTLAAGATSLLAAPVAFAQGLFSGISNPSAGFSNFGDLINQGINLIFIIAGIAVLVYLFFGAFTYLTAGDNEDQVKSARTRITNAIVGLIILAAAWAIWRFIINIIPGLESLLGIQP